MTGYVGSELELFEHAVNWKRYWSSRIKPYIGETVLEIGAGLGSNTPLLISDSVASWHCVEPDASLLSKISEKVAMHVLPPTCTTQVGTIDSLKKESLYDTILYIDVMEHIESDADEFRKAEEHLLPGGHLVVLSPAHQALFSPFDSAIGHFRRYNRRSLQRLGQLPSLTTVRLVYLDSVGLAASLANRVLLKHSMPTSTQIHLWDSVMVRLSMLIDPILLNRAGKTIVGIWKKS